MSGVGREVGDLYTVVDHKLHEFVIKLMSTVRVHQLNTGSNRLRSFRNLMFLFLFAVTEEQIIFSDAEDGGPLSPLPLQIKIIDVRSVNDEREPWDPNKYLNELVEQLAEPANLESTHVVVNQATRRRYTLKKGFDALNYMQDMVRMCQEKGPMSFHLHEAQLLTIPQVPAETFTEGEFSSFICLNFIFLFLCCIH